MAPWKRALYVLWMVQFLTTLAMNLGLTFVPFFLAEDPALRVTDERELLLYTSLILAGPFFTTILVTPLWGWLGDRSGHQRQVVRAALGLGLTQLLMAVAQSPQQLVAIRLLQGLLSGVVAACLGLMATMAPEAHRGRAISALQSSTPAGQILGPVFGGLLATTLGFRSVYWLLGAVVIFSGLIALVFLREEGFVPRRHRANPFTELFAALGQVWGHAALRAAFAILLVGQIAWTSAQVVFAIYAGKLITAWVAESGAAPAWWNTGVGFTAIAMSVTAGANFALAFWWGRSFDRGRAHLTAWGASALSVSLLALALWPPWWGVLLARVGIGGGLGGASSLQYAAISGHTPAESRGQFMGLATSVHHAGNLIGFVGGGALAQLWGESGNFVLAAALWIVVMLLALRLERLDPVSGILGS